MQRPSATTEQVALASVDASVLEALLGTAPPTLDPVAQAQLGAAFDLELARLSAFVPAPLLQEQWERPEVGRICGAYWRGSLLFADLSGFTALSERLSALGREGAEEISRIINRLFGHLLDEVQRNGGAVLKFGGDALTAFFDAEALGLEHAALACHAALAMQQRMNMFAALATRGGPATLRLRIGVHSGRFFAAQVGDASHIELIVTGPAVNRVALAQESAHPGEVVVSDATLALLDQPTSVARPHGFSLLHSFTTPTRLAPSAQLPQTVVWTPEALRAAAARIVALRPYLTWRLPERFLGLEAESGMHGEFRPVTVLFANFSSFSELLAGLGDATDQAAQILNAYYRRAQSVVHAYGGSVNKIDLAPFGDKLMALFGAPLAHGNDAEHALYAALELRPALDEANAEIAALLAQADIGGYHAWQLQQRIGINTGTVFAGLVGSNARREYTVMGSNVNLAARLMGVAQAGQILLAPSIRRLAEQRFSLLEGELVRLKGVAQPVRPTQLIGPLEQTSEQPATLGQLVPLIGRASELERCLAEAMAALDGQGRVLAIVGDAGTGKTRLAEEVLHRLIPADPGWATARVFELYSVECLSFQQNTPYAPVQQLLRRLLGFASGAALSAAVVEEQVAARAPELLRFAPLLLRLFGLPAAETPLIAALTPEQQRDRLHELLMALLLHETKRTPLVLLVDDLQWVDDASHALLAQLATALPGYPVLLLLVYRPDAALPEPWNQSANAVRVALGELTDDERVALVTAMLGGEPPEELFGLLERAQGNPFFIEELIRTLVEQHALLPSEQGWHLSAAAEHQQLPDTIEGVITARLDLLAEQERDVLQVAAVIGRRFPEPVLQGVYTPDEVLSVVLGELAADNLILPDNGGRERAYLFRQALTREVAYESILFARRRELNREVARCIEALYGHDRAAQLAPLARHYLLAEEWATALRYHLEAGQRAVAQFANRSAIALFEQALAIAPRLVAHEAYAAAQSDWQRLGEAAPLVATTLEALGNVLMTSGAYNEALTRYREALDLLKGNPAADPQHLGRIFCQMGTTCERKGDFERAFASLTQAQTILGQQPSKELARVYLLGAALYHRQGNYLDSIEWAEHARVLAQKSASDRDQAHAYMLLGGNYHGLGETATAIANTRRSLEMFRQVEDFAGVAKAHNNLGGILHDTGEWDQAQRAYRSAAEIEQMLGDRYGQAKIANNLGEVLRGLGDLDGAIEQYTTALKAMSASQFGSAVITMNLGATHLLRGDFAAATVLLQRSRELFDSIAAEDFLPELLRYQAELALLQGDVALALHIAQAAVQMARRLEAPLEEGVALRVQAQVLLHQQRFDAAANIVDDALTVLRDINNPHELARALLVAAELAAQQQRHADGQRVFNEAVELLARLQARLDLQYAQHIAGVCGYTFSCI